MVPERSQPFLNLPKPCQGRTLLKCLVKEPPGPLKQISDLQDHQNHLQGHQNPRQEHQKHLQDHQNHTQDLHWLGLVVVLVVLVILGVVQVVLEVVVV